MTVEFISQSISTEVWHQAGVVLATPGPPVRLAYWDTAVVKMSGNILGRTAQSLKYLVADMCLTADPEFASLIPARSHTFREIADHGILISTTILSLPLI